MSEYFKWMVVSTEHWALRTRVNVYAALTERPNDRAPSVQCTTGWKWINFIGKWLIHMAFNAYWSHSRRTIVDGERRIQDRRKTALVCRNMVLYACMHEMCERAASNPPVTYKCKWTKSNRRNCTTNTIFWAVELLGRIYILSIFNVIEFERRSPTSFYSN